MKMIKVIAAAVGLLFFFAAGSAQASFENRQIDLYNVSVDQYNQIMVDLDDLIFVYIVSDEVVLWNNPEIKQYYQSYLANFNGLQRGLNKINNVSKQYFKKQKAQLSGYRGQCRKKVQVRVSAAERLMKRLGKNYQAAGKKAQLIIDQNKILSGWINSPGSVTDGYIDDAIYDFGGGLIAIAPGTSPPFDPDPVEGLFNLVADYHDQAEAVYESTFYRQMEAAKKIVRSCS